MRKSTVKRLHMMVRHLQKREERLQQIYGDASKGSMRASDKRDCEALIDVINSLHLLDAPASRTRARISGEGA